MKYKVTITETLQLDVEVEASSREEAEDKVESNWKNSEYILDSAHFKEVDFRAKEVREKSKNELWR